MPVIDLLAMFIAPVSYPCFRTGGFNFWINELDQGTSKEEVLIGFSESIENQLSLVGIVQTGIEFTRSYPLAFLSGCNV